VIERRSFACGAALLGLLARLPAAAQPANRLPRVASISVETPLAHMVGPDPINANTRGLVHGLRDLGWVDGRNLIIEHRSAEGRPERVPALLREVIDLRVDVIVTAGTPMVRAARQATDTIAIVAIGPNLVGLGLANSLARPGGNVTGLPFYAGPSMFAKRLELLKRAAPAVTRIAFLAQGPAAGQAMWSAETAEAARTLGLVLSGIAVDRPEDLDSAFASMSRQRPDAILATDTPVNLGNRARIVEFATRERLPAIYGLRQFPEAGGLMSYGIDIPDLTRRAARYVDRILKGAKPGELPIELPTRFEFVINLKAAKALGLTIPKVLLLQADEVIQ
jgi:putative ABC transport system substrate-binding protein